MKTVQNLVKRARLTGAIAVVGGLLFFTAGTPGAHAESRADCEHHIEKAEAKLDQAIRAHGERSGQANDRRRDLDAERERCWDKYHGWWDGHAHQWHDQRDWDHDHDDHH